MDNNTEVRPELVFIADEVLTYVQRSRPAHERSRQQLTHREEFGGHCVSDRCVHDSSGVLDVWVIAAGISLFALLVNEIIIVKLAIATAAFLHYVLNQIHLGRQFALHRRDAAITRVTVADVYRYWNNTSARILSVATNADPTRNAFAYIARRLEATDHFGETPELKNDAAAMLGELRDLMTQISSVAENQDRFLTIATDRPAHRIRLCDLSPELRDAIAAIDDWLNSVSDFAEWIDTLRSTEIIPDHTKPLNASEVADVDFALNVFAVELPSTL